MNTAFPGAESVGRVIDGRFRLLHWLGGTEHSGVFLTLIAGNQPRSAAIKLVRADEVDEVARNTMWTTAKTLSHPNLMRLLYCGACEIDGIKLLYTVEDYAEEILSEVLRGRPLTAIEAREMLPAIVGALSYLHARGIVHGALTPSNLMAVGDRLKLSVDRIETASEAAIGSHWSGGYNAPEIAEGKMTPAADVWSLGVVLVQALTQQAPAWRRGDGGEPGVPASMPEPFANIARGCLRVEPEQRCTLPEVKARLAGTIVEVAAAPVPEPAKQVRKARSRVPAAIAVLVVVMVGVLIAAVELTRRPAKPQPYAVAQAPVAAPAATPEAQASAPLAKSPAPVTEKSTPVAEPPAPVAQKPAPSGETRAPEAADARGAVIHRAMPDVPQTAVETIHGHFRVGIRVEVDADGNVSHAAIDSQGPSRYFAQFALNAAREWKFKPAEQEGHAVASAWNLEFVFGREGATVTPVETTP